MVIACRDQVKAQEAATEIAEQTGNKVYTLKLDLASLSSIRSAVEELKSRYSSIHILINNAGKSRRLECSIHIILLHRDC